MLDVVRHGPLSQDTEEGEEAGEVHPGPFQGGAIKAIKAHPEDDGVGAHDEVEPTRSAPTTRRATRDHKAKRFRHQRRRRREYGKGLKDR